MDVIIREAIEDDFEALNAIYLAVDRIHEEAVPQAFRKPEGDARPREFVTGILCSDEATIFVAEVEDRIVGLVEGYMRTTPDHPLGVRRRYGLVHDLVVSNEFRGQGIGRALMERFERWAKGEGADNLELTVWAFNESAISAYKALGYEFAHHRMWKFLK